MKFNGIQADHLNNFFKNNNIFFLAGKQPKTIIPFVI